MRGLRAIAMLQGKSTPKRLQHALFGMYVSSLEELSEGRYEFRHSEMIGMGSRLCADKGNVTWGRRPSSILTGESRHESLPRVLEVCC